MNEKQILKEIAYYSSKFLTFMVYICLHKFFPELINSHQRRNQHLEKIQDVKGKYNYKPYDAYVSSSDPYNVNKYKYVKKPESSVILPVQEQISNKVLINPNFRQSVHINPRFNATKQEQTVPKVGTTVVHVNPKIINVNFIRNQKPLVMKCSNAGCSLKQAITKSNVPLDSFKSQRNKTVKTPLRKRRVSIRSKYKIIKSTVLKSPVSNNKTIIKNRYKIVKSATLKSPPSAHKTIRNRYKIDRRKVVKMRSRKKVIVQSINDSLRSCLFKNKTWRKSTLVSPGKIPKLKADGGQKRSSLTVLRTRRFTDSSKKFHRSVTNLKVGSSFKHASGKNVVNAKRFSLASSR